MKKDKEWLKDNILKLENNPSWGNSDYHLGYSDAFETFEGLIDQLEETEITEDQAWEVIESANHKHIAPDYVWIYKKAIQKGLTPTDILKPKLPVIPQFVADWYEERSDYIYYHLCKAIQYAGNENEHSMSLAPIEFWLMDFENENIGKLLKMKDGYTIEPPKILQVIVKNYDSTVFTTELPEDEAMKLIEGWKK